MSPWYEMRGEMNVLVLRWFLVNSALILRGCLRCACACVSLAWSLAKNRPEPAISVVPDVTFFAAFMPRNRVTQPRCFPTTRYLTLRVSAYAGITAPGIAL